MNDYAVWCVNCQCAHSVEGCPLKGKCLFCKERPATLHFGDLLSLTHGGQLNCCELCCAEKQLEFAEERAAAIPVLAAKVVRLREEGQGGVKRRTGI